MGASAVLLCVLAAGGLPASAEPPPQDELLQRAAAARRQGDLAEARRLARRASGADAEALRADPRWTFLLAWLDREEDRLETAVQRWGRLADLASLPPEVATYARGARRRLAEVDGLVDASGEGGPLRSQQAAPRGRAEDSGGDPRDPVADHLARAEAALRKGATGDAQQHLIAATEDPTHPDFARAQAALSAIAPDWSPPRELLERRADAFRRAGRHQAAAELLDTLPLPTARRARREALARRGMAHFRRRDSYSTAATLLEASARLGGPERFRRAYRAAVARSRAGDDAAAIRALETLVRRDRANPKAPQALFLAAVLRLDEDPADGVAALARFRRSITARLAPGLVRQALLREGLAWLSELDRPERARRLFRELARRAERASAVEEAATAWYWVGRTFPRGNADAADPALIQAIQTSALGLPAAWARGLRAQLGRDPLPDDPGAPPAGSVTPEAPPSVALPEAACFFQRVGFPEEAARVVSARAAQVAGAAPEGRGEEALAAAFDRLGAPAYGWRRASRSLGSLPRPPPPEERWRIAAAYPRPHRALVEEAARGLPAEAGPELLWAMMRQESGYEPEAVSSAGALGLMQLMPSTARRIARRQGLVPVDPPRLLEPEVGLGLAGRHLAALFRELGCLPLVVAAYNAGAAAVRRWARGHPDWPLDVFVTRIPYRETRRYVARVLEHHLRYRWSTTEDAEPPALPWGLRPVASCLAGVASQP